MAKAPWLTILGVNEDAGAGLSPACQDALARAEVVMGPPRHLALIGDTPARQIEWPVPFADGIAQMLALRGQNTVVLASGDPFWFGAGSPLTRALKRTEWQAIPAPSTFSLAASELGWPLQEVTCLGLHAAPLSRLRPHLAQGARLIVTLRDGAAVADLAAYLDAVGFGRSGLEVLEALGGPNARRTHATAASLPDLSFHAPVCAAISCVGDGLSRASGLPDALFTSDGTMTKRPVRALTLSALAPRPYEHLWDIGGGSGSVAIEWLLSDPRTQATTIEPRADRVAAIRKNAVALGVDRLNILHGSAPEALTDLPRPDAVFVGGGGSDALLAHLWETLPPGTRLVMNAVTLESEALVTAWQADKGGTLMRVVLSHAEPLGPKRGWRASLPIVQWSVTR